MPGDKRILAILAVKVGVIHPQAAGTLVGKGLQYLGTVAAVRYADGKTASPGDGTTAASTRQISASSTLYFSAMRGSPFATPPGGRKNFCRKGTFRKGMLFGSRVLYIGRQSVRPSRFEKDICVNLG